MSSINDALRRVSRDPDTPGSGEMFSQYPIYSRRRSIGLWLGLSLAAAVVGAWFLFFRPSPPPQLVTAARPVKAVVAPAGRAAPAKSGPQTTTLIKKEAPARPPAPASPSPAGPAASVKPKVLPGSSPPDKKPMAKAQVKPAGSKDPALALKVRPSPDPAENPLRRALAHSSKPPATAQDHFQAARAAQDRGLDSKAVHHYRQALLADPRLAEAYLNLGNIFFFRQRSPKKALEMYKQVLRLDPNNKMAHNNLGVIFFRQGLPGKARTEFSAALQKNPNYVDALYNMACLAANTGEPSQAMSYLSRAVRIQPEAAVWAAEDEDLKSLRRRPEFQELARRAETIQPQGK